MRIEGDENDEEEPEADKEIRREEFRTHGSSQFSFPEKSDIPSDHNEENSWNRKYLNNNLIKLKSRPYDWNDEIQRGRKLEATGLHNEPDLRHLDLPVYRGHEPGEAETWGNVTLEVRGYRGR